MFAAVAQAQTADTSGKLKDLDAVVNKALKDWQVPGISIAVVQNGKVIYAKGFGYRDVEKKLPVTTDTLFAIGSVTKSFTSLLFGMLNDEGKVDWDTPVRTYIPELTLDDPIANDHATPRDLFSHRTGMAPSDLIWYSSDFTRADLVHRMRYLKFDSEFRRKYEYCNLMIMTMGYLEERVMNSTWEDLTRKRIFEPLGMSNSNFSVTDSQKAADFALPYELKKDVVTKVPFKKIDAIGPAGSINSSINDMAKYAIFQLSDGTTSDGKRLVSEKNLKLVHTGQTAMGALPPSFSQGGIGPMVYAMGWVDTSYRGHRMVWHNGGIDGFHSLLTMLPDDKTAVVMLSNQGNNPILEAIAYTVYDRLLEMPAYPWFDKYKELHDKAKKDEAEAEAKEKQAEVVKKGTHASHPMADFAGVYSNPAFGDLTITVKGDGLEAKLNSLDVTALNRVHYDIFEIPEGANAPGAGSRIQFFMNKDGDINRVAAAWNPSLPDDVVFTKALEKK
jgi:CubicO group peptidase (beta-lactamase class C family)